MKTPKGNEIPKKKEKKWKSAKRRKRKESFEGTF